MQQADFTRFRNVMAGMAELYSRELSNTLLDVYWLALRSWTLAEFEAAADKLMQTATFMPRPAEFNEIRKAALPTKGEAWAAVLMHLRGGYRDGSGISPETDAAVRALGGYKTLAMMPTTDLHWQEKRFAEHYGEAAEVADKREPLQIPADLRKLLGAA
jgi:hypothetical protein